LHSYLENLTYFHSEDVTLKRYAANGRLSFELIVDSEHTLEYVQNVMNFFKLAATNIDDNAFELEKNIYITKLIEKYDDVKKLAEKQAKEIAVNKQSFSVNSEILNINMMNAEDAIKLLKETINKDVLTCVYLGPPLKEEVLASVINNN